MRYTINVEVYRTWNKELELEVRCPDFKFPPQPEDQTVIYKETCEAASEAILFDRTLPLCLSVIRDRVKENNLGPYERYRKDKRDLDLEHIHSARYQGEIVIGYMTSDPWRLSEFIKRIQIVDDEGETVVEWGEWWGMVGRRSEGEIR